LRRSRKPDEASPIDDHVNRETWRRILAAHIQPLADAAD
jgi:hypothetical protein